jgi:glutathione S-transferase
VRHRPVVDQTAPAWIGTPGVTATLASRGPDDEAFLLGDRASAADCRRAATVSRRPAAAGPAIRRWSLGLGVRRLAIRDPRRA